MCALGRSIEEVERHLRSCVRPGTRTVDLKDDGMAGPHIVALDVDRFADDDPYELGSGDGQTARCSNRPLA